MCKCCESIEFWKNSNKETDNKIGMSHKMFAKICSYGWRKRRAKN